MTEKNIYKEVEMITAKRKLISFIKSLPNDFSYEELIFNIVLKDMIDKGIPLPDDDFLDCENSFGLFNENEKIEIVN